MNAAWAINENLTRQSRQDPLLPSIWTNPYIRITWCYFLFYFIKKHGSTTLSLAYSYTFTLKLTNNNYMIDIIIWGRHSYFLVTWCFILFLHFFYRYRWSWKSYQLSLCYISRVLLLLLLDSSGCYLKRNIGQWINILCFIVRG